MDDYTVFVVCRSYVLPWIVLSIRTLYDLFLTNVLTPVADVWVSHCKAYAHNNPMRWNQSRIAQCFVWNKKSLVEVTFEPKGPPFPIEWISKTVALKGDVFSGRGYKPFLTPSVKRKMLHTFRAVLLIFHHTSWQTGSQVVSKYVPCVYVNEFLSLLLVGPNWPRTCWALFLVFQVTSARTFHCVSHFCSFHTLQYND